MAALKHGKKKYEFRLYLAKGIESYDRIVSVVQAALEEKMPGQYELKILDIVKQPQQALNDGIVATPTLVKLSPLPVEKHFGNLANRERVFAILDQCR